MKVGVINVYDAIFDRYKEYIINNSKYSPKIVKINNNTSTYFPIIVCMLSDTPDNGYTQKHIDESTNYYFTIEIYAKNKKNVASQIIIDELRNLTNNFFGNKLNMKKTLDQSKPNIDTEIFRQVIYYQCSIDNRGNITRI